MTVLSLVVTALLAALDAAVSARAFASGAPETSGVLWAQLFWMLLSILVFLYFTSRGTWAGAPAAQIAYVLAGGFVMASTADGSPIFLAYRVVGAAVVFVLAATTLRAVATREADEGDPPRRVAALSSAAAVLAALACLLAVRARTLAPPEAVGAIPGAAPAAPVERTVAVAGRVLRPDGVPLPGVTVTIATDGLAARRFRLRGDAAVRTNREGRFAFEGLSSDERPPCRLTIQAPGYKPKTVSAFAGASRLDVVLSPDL